MPAPTQGQDSEGNLPWLYAGRAIRSFATAFLTVVFPLYLARQHLSSTTVGAVLTAGSFLGAGLVAAVGIVGDRIGRRPVLIGVGLLGVLGALALAGSTNVAVAAVASGLGGIGRGGGAGSGGAFGPFFPAEQPLLAASVPPAQRTRAFARLGLLGVLAAAAGSLVAGLPAALHDLGLSVDAGYRLVFVLGALCSLVVVLVSLPLREPRPSRSSQGAGSAALAAEAAAEEGPTTGAAHQGSAGQGSPGGLSTRQLIGRLGLTNALNGFGFGFLGPLLTYWFHVRFGVGSAEVGLVFTVVNLLSALPYLGADRLTARLGAVRTVAVTRGLSVLLLIGMAPAPTFAIAAVLLTLRTVANSLGIPARQSYTMGVADERRRGTVAALGTLPSMVTSSISPVVGGAIMGAFVDIPIVGAAVFMGANTLSYYLAFRHAPPPEEQGRPARAALRRSEEG
ncbi:MFS transporter [Aciditerrimonas ferrireducens]|uniref:MFS transporter n=1 Tax=Aciditerrimonas ferrireducens TaxID=667306 RepID=A0ABV6C5Y0_9ACTN